MTTLDSLLVSYVVDCSGSTAWNCIDTKVMNRSCPLIDFEKYVVKAGLIALAHVADASRCSMYAACSGFNDKAWGVFAPKRVTHGNLHDLLDAVGALKSGGETDFDAPLTAAIAEARDFVLEATGRERTRVAAHIFFLTDGLGSYTHGANFKQAVNGLPISVHVIGLGYAAARGMCVKISDDLGGLFLYGNKADNYLNTIQHSHARILSDVINEGLTRLVPRKLTGPERGLFDEVSLAVSGMAAANDYYSAWHASGAAARLVEAFRRAPPPHRDNTVEMGKAVASRDAFDRWGSKAISVWLSEFKYGFCGTVLNRTTLEFTSPAVTRVLELIMDTQTYYEPVPGKYIQFKEDAYGNQLKDMFGRPIPWEAEVDPAYFDTPEQAAVFQAQQTAEAREAADKDEPLKITSIKVNPGGCFSEHTMIEMYDPENHQLRAGDLRAGDKVVSNDGSCATIEAVFKSPAASKPKVLLRNQNASLVITDNHPLHLSWNNTWIWAKDSTLVVEAVLDREDKEMDAIVSVMFDDASHARGCRYVVAAGHFRIIAAGHEIQDHPVTTHSFWGSRQALRAYIANIHPNGLPKHGVVRMMCGQER